MRTYRRTDGRTDMTKIIVIFRNFVNAPKNDGDSLVIKLSTRALQVTFTGHSGESSILCMTHYVRSLYSVIK